MTSVPIAVVSAGAVTSVGLSWAATCAAIRASLDGFTETHFKDEVGAPLLGARVDDASLGLSVDDPAVIHGGVGKWVQMLVRAARESAINAGRLDASRTALLLLGPEANRDSHDPEALQDCFHGLQDAVGHSFHADSRILSAGSVGLGAALEYARGLLLNQTVDTVLLGGVDSLLNTSDINRHLASGRLLSSENSDGFIPGEAAAALILRRIDTPPSHPVLYLRGIGQAQESASWSSGQPNYGKGLAQALREALSQAGLQPHEIHHRFSNAAGESFFMDEDTFAWSRVLRALNPVGYTQPLIAASVGQCGAAQSILAIALALDMVHKGWACGGNLLVHAANADGDRAAVVLQAA